MDQQADIALPDPRICDLARKSRDARFDGLFFTAASSTGIYCRPVCPAPAARRTNVRYYANAAAAEADGFRPCLRCRPELAPGNDVWRHGDDVVANVLKLIADGALAEQSLEQLAARVGISGRQLRRLFVQRVGVPPHNVYTTQRLLFAKQLLTETALPVTEVALASGFRSLRRFNAAFAQANRIEPRQLRRTPRAAKDAPLVLRLAYRPPYAFGAVLEFLRTRALPGVECVDAHGYARVFGPATAPGWLILDPWPGRAHNLRLRVHCPNATELLGVVTRVRRMFDLDANPALINGAFAADPLLGPLCARHPGLRVPGSWDGFETAVRAVLGQQVSVAAARTLAARIVQRYGTPLATPPQPGLERLFPAPDALATADLRGLGVTTSRARTIQGIAQALQDRRVTFDPAQPLDEFVRRWTALPGIGPWTAHYIAMRVQNEPDAFPAADLVLRRAAAGGGTPLSERGLLARATAWRPWRAYAVMQLWRASGERAAIEARTTLPRSD